MENLSYDLLRTDKASSRDAILDRIKAINEARSEGVVGKSSNEVDARDTKGDNGTAEPPPPGKPEDNGGTEEPPPTQ